MKTRAANERPRCGMRIAVASAFRECGLPSDEQDVDDFLVALRSLGYVVERLDHRTGDE
jgi:hypothetical protein